MNLLLSILPLGLFAANAFAIDMVCILPSTLHFYKTNPNFHLKGIREGDQDWVELSGIQTGVCEIFDFNVTQASIVPWSNPGQGSFICTFYYQPDCQGERAAVIASNHPLGSFDPPSLSVLCVNACCWGAP
ncbi:hypothetical protein BJX99DRAFT_254556 [Aspergillus californicus]